MDMWKRDSVYILLVLSGIIDAPRAGVMSSRSVRKDLISNSWSSLMLTVSGTSLQSALVIPLAIITIDVQRDRITPSLRSAFVMIGNIDVKIARAEVVACRQGGSLLGTIEKEYLRTIGLASAASADDKASLVYIL